MGETRQDRFKRLATQRTNAILNKLRLLGNLSNKANYDYSEDEIHKIFKALQEKLNETKARFVIKKDKEFKL